ncbi:hypothetical protein [Enterococcus sp. LJL51]
MTVEMTGFLIQDEHMGTVTQMNHTLEFQYMEQLALYCITEKTRRIF